MAALETVADYLAQARSLLQDLVAPYRYSDSELVDYLNMGLLEVRKLRPDLMLATPTNVPSYSAFAQATSVAMDPQYRVALLYFTAGQAQLRDQEEVSDARALAFITNFTNQLLANGA